MSKFTLTPQEFLKLRAGGVKMAPRTNGEAPATPPTTEQILADLVRAVGRLADMKPPEVEVSVDAPRVTVAAPSVTVNAPASPRHWVFKHKLNNHGDVIETTAEAKD